jgi:hypothetical protein
MSENFAETVRTVQFRKAVDFALNETPGKLRPLCEQASYTGKKVQVEDQFGDLVAREITTRNAETALTDPDIVRRWLIKPPRAQVAVLVDPDDQMQTEVGLNSPLATQVARAIRRYQDDKVLEAFYGTAYTGEEGATATTFSSGNIIAVDQGSTGTDTGLVLAKLIRLRRLLQASFIDLDMVKPVIPVTAPQVEDLLQINQVQNRDFNPMNVQALQNGQVTEFMGFRFLPCEIGNASAFPRSYASTLSGSNRRVPVIIPGWSMHFGNWLDFEGHTDTRADKSHSEQIAGYTCGTATRKREAYCFQILCKEAA